MTAGYSVACEWPCISFFSHKLCPSCVCSCVFVPIFHTDGKHPAKGDRSLAGSHRPAGTRLRGKTARAFCFACRADDNSSNLETAASLHLEQSVSSELCVLWYAWVFAVWFGVVLVAAAVGCILVHRLISRSLALTKLLNQTGSC